MSDKLLDFLTNFLNPSAAPFQFHFNHHPALSQGLGAPALVLGSARIEGLETSSGLASVRKIPQIMDFGMNDKRLLFKSLSVEWSKVKCIGYPGKSWLAQVDS